MIYFLPTRREGIKEEEEEEDLYFQTI